MDWMKDLLVNFPGLAFVVPITAGALAAFRWLLSRHDVQFARRKEFLFHWKNAADLDDLSVEVLVRQLTGTYLPAVVVRRVCSRKNAETAQTLLRLADIWSLVVWDADEATASWKPRTAHPVFRKLRELGAWVAFFVAFIFGASVVFYVGTEKPSGTTSLVAAAWGVTLVAACFVPWTRTNVWGTANNWGDALLREANGCVRVLEPASDGVQTAE